MPVSRRLLLPLAAIGLAASIAVGVALASSGHPRAEAAKSAKHHRLTAHRVGKGTYTHRVFSWMGAGTSGTPQPNPGTPTPLGTPPPPPVVLHCDVTVAGRAALEAAVNSSANDGHTICAGPGDYGTTAFNWTVVHSALTRVVAQPANWSISMPGVIFHGASNLSIEGFNLTTGSSIESGASHIHLVKNRIKGTSEDALDLHDSNSDVWFVGNLVQDIRFTGDAFTGYGIQTVGGPTNGFHANDNTFDMGNMSADGMQLGDIHDFELVGNVITNVFWGGDSSIDPHADAIMLWNGASNGLVKDNRVTDSTDTLWSGSTTDVRMENNLFARLKGLCHDGGPTGSSSAGLVRYTWVRNTMWDCGSYWSGLGYGLETKGPGSDNVLQRNLLISVDYDTALQFTEADHNLLGTDGFPGATDRRFTPVFADRVDYLPTNLPPGYQDVGYRKAPAGYQAAP